MNYAPNRGKPWTADDDTVLMALRAKHWSWRAIATYFGRTTMSVAGRLTVLHKAEKFSAGGSINPRQALDLDTKQAGTILDSGG